MSPYPMGQFLEQHIQNNVQRGVFLNEIVTNGMSNLMQRQTMKIPSLNAYPNLSTDTVQIGLYANIVKYCLKHLLKV